MESSYPQLPISIKEHISNANYYLNAEGKIPSRTFDAIRISLLLTAWENVQIAEDELSSWVECTPLVQKLYKSHAYKFRNVRKSKSIDQISINLQGKAETTTYATGDDFKRLLQICRYGFETGTKELSKIFKTDWYFEEFKRALISKIKSREKIVEIYENLLNSEDTT